MTDTTNTGELCFHCGKMKEEHTLALAQVGIEHEFLSEVEGYARENAVELLKAAEAYVQSKNNHGFSASDQDDRQTAWNNLKTAIEKSRPAKQ